MENFVADGAAVEASKRKRVTHSAERVEEAVGLARHIGSTAAAAQINRKLKDSEKIPVGTVDKWLYRFRKEGKFWETQTKRGRPALLDSAPGMREEWQKQIDSLQRQGASVSGRVSAAITKAVMEEKTPSLLERHGGSAKVTPRTGQMIMAAAGLTPRKKTSSRILPPDSMVGEARDKFYADLRACFPDDAVDPHLLLNFDQTFQVYHPSRGFTWEKKGAVRVQVKDSKDGFTLLPVVSAAGIVGAQMIFDGSTAASLPKVPSGELLKFAQTSTHWSNEETTIQLFRTIILPHIAARRRSLGNGNAPAIVLADAFAPHWTRSVLELIQKQTSVAYVCIPDALTHVFQPLDLGIIAAIKNSVMRRMDDFLEAEVRTAIKEKRVVTLATSRPVLRDRMTMFIKECLADPVICAERCCRAGFSRAGVLFALFGEGDRPPDVNSLVPCPLCEECGEPAVQREHMPPCSCFPSGVLKLLCDGCFANHSTLCDTFAP